MSSNLNISGITLTVEACGDQPAESLTFYKSETQAISIGRRSTQSIAQQDGVHEVGRALFRCPIVSRKHAKITFTEFGNAYIIDLNSHHGTYIMRPRESIVQPIKPEAHTVLADGDRLTFGKKVGQDDNVVHPITVSVKLLYESESPSQTATRSKSSAESSHPNPVARSSSGRYGVPSISSESSPSDSDQDSDSDPDVREISPPSVPDESRPYPASHWAGTLPSQSITSRTGFLRRFLPPIYSASFCNLPIIIDEDEAGVSSNGLREMLTTAVPTPAVNEVIDVDDASDSRGSSPPVCNPCYGKVGNVASHPQTTADWSEMPIRSPSPVNVDAIAADDTTAAVREESMDLSTPEPMQAVNEEMQSSGSQLRDAGSTDIPDVVNTASTSSQSFDHRQPEVEITSGQPFSLAGVSFGEAQQMRVIHDAFYESIAMDGRMTQCTKEVGVASEQIAVLHAARRADEMRFDEHVEETKTRLEALEQRMLDAHVRITSSTVANDIQITDVTSRMEELRETMLRHQAERNAVEDDICETSTREMKDALEEMHKCCADTERNLRNEREAVSKLVAEAKSAAQHVTEQIQTATLPIKRKRSLEEYSFKFGDFNESNVQNAPDDRDEPRPKRRRTISIASKIARTAAAATMGAALAWLALATTPD